MIPRLVSHGHLHPDRPAIELQFHAANVGFDVVIGLRLSHGLASPTRDLGNPVIEVRFGAGAIGKGKLERVIPSSNSSLLFGRPNRRRYSRSHMAHLMIW